ncbi:MAG: hypothetical protein IIB38_07470 [Candidatus Hydrogenedentes bacterium]|nr:hypothetical protein [Candidatus Hydrogenedentota bacterium]
MTTETSPKPDSSARRAASPLSRHGGAGRWRVWRFVILFCIYVFSMLMGYRYLLNTEASMWYLFQVGRHTAALLDVIGDSGTLEPVRSTYGSGKKRAQLEAWRSGASYQDAPSSAYVDERPLSPWESWLHKAYTDLHANKGLDASGPVVDFVLREGLLAEIARLEGQIAQRNADAALDSETRKEQNRILEKQRKKLVKRNRDLKADDPKARAKREGRRFRFVVVPDCGAIPSLSIYASAVLAFPVAFRKRLFGLGLGIPLLYAINLCRLATLAVIGALDDTPSEKWFTFAHEYLWQGIFVVFVVAVWMLWIEFVVRERSA